MYRTSIAFHRKIYRDKIPISYIMIETDMGARAYGEKELSLVASATGYKADGTVLADGTVQATVGVELIEKSGRLMSMSGFKRTAHGDKRGILLGYSTKKQQNMIVSLNNTDQYFSKLIPKEPFLTKQLSVYIGFEELPFEEALAIFEGTITEIKISKNLLTVEAIE